MSPILSNLQNVAIKQKSLKQADELTPYVFDYQRRTHQLHITGGLSSAF